MDLRHHGNSIRIFMKIKNLEGKEYDLAEKPKTMNEYGTILLEDNTDPFILKENGKYWANVWLTGQIPLPSSYCIIEVLNTDNTRKSLRAIYPSLSTEFVNYYNDGTWSGWKQITETHTGVMMLNGWIVNGHEPILTKIGNIVWMNAIMRKGANTVGTIMANIPEEYRPYHSINVALISSLGNGLANIGDDGNLKIVSVIPDITNVQIISMWRTC